MILGLHHAQNTIPKGAEDEGKKFYCEILGLPEKEKPESLKVSWRILDNSRR